MQMQMQRTISSTAIEVEPCLAISEPGLQCHMDALQGSRYCSTHIKRHNELSSKYNDLMDRVLNKPDRMIGGPLIASYKNLASAYAILNEYRLTLLTPSSYEQVHDILKTETLLRLIAKYENTIDGRNINGKEEMFRFRNDRIAYTKQEIAKKDEYLKAEKMITDRRVFYTHSIQLNLKNIVPMFCDEPNSELIGIGLSRLFFDIHNNGILSLQKINGSRCNICNGPAYIDFVPVVDEDDEGMSFDKVLDLYHYTYVNTIYRAIADYRSQCLTVSMKFAQLYKRKGLDALKKPVLFVIKSHHEFGFYLESENMHHMASCTYLAKS